MIIQSKTSQQGYKELCPTRTETAVLIAERLGLDLATLLIDEHYLGLWIFAKP